MWLTDIIIIIIAVVVGDGGSSSGFKYVHINKHMIVYIQK